MDDPRNYTIAWLLSAPYSELIATYEKLNDSDDPAAALLRHCIVRALVRYR